MWRIMRRIGLLALILLMALAGPASTVLSAPLAQDVNPAAPDAFPDDEIILIESNGRLRVVDPFVAPGTKDASWDSGGDVGWTNVAAGDFNGDGDAELVAVRGGTIRVFDPVIQPGMPQVTGLDDSVANRGFRNLITGDFDGDGRDEIVATHTQTGVAGEYVIYYDGGTNGTSWTSSFVKPSPFGTVWQAVAAGNLNGDSYDDLILVRRVDNLVKVFFGPHPTWSELGDVRGGFPWLQVAAGNLSNAYGGEEIVLLREGVQAVLPSVILYRLSSGGALVDLLSEAEYNDYKFVPYFTSVGLGDVNGDGDDEIFLLRDPETDTGTSLIMRNPAGTGINTFEQQIGRSFRQVRAGDVDADGLDEVVVLAADRYRIYTDPRVGGGYTDAGGSFNTATFTIANVDGAGVSAGPALNLDPTTVLMTAEYGNFPGAIVSITNTGNDEIINWTATRIGGDAWLSLDTTGGTSPGILRLNADTVAAGLGVHTAIVRFTASSGSWSTQRDLEVTLNVTDPGFVVMPSALSFFVQPGGSATQQLQLLRPSGQTVSWAAAAVPAEVEAAFIAQLARGEAQVSAQGAIEGSLLAPPPWLSLDPSEGSVTTTGTVNVTVNTSGLANGLYKAVILIVADPGGPEQTIRPVTVLLSVTDQVRTIYLPQVSS